MTQVENEPIKYYYDGQIRRILQQVGRIFSYFKYKDGSGTLRKIPVTYGTRQRMAAQILRNNTENTVNPIPFISFYITSIEIPDNWRIANREVNSIQVHERKFDRTTGQYSSEKGNSYRIDRYSPVAQSMQLNVDVWTSNMEQKLQLFEQMTMYFNAGIDLQTGTNPLDWTSIMDFGMRSINWTSNVPGGGMIDDMPEIFTLGFELKYWISPPARVSPLVDIKNIISRVGPSTDPSLDEIAGWSPDDYSQHITTPGNHQIEVFEGNKIRLLGPNSNETDDDGNPYSWPQLIDLYGELRNGYSRLRLRSFVAVDIEDIDLDIIGSISYHPTQDDILLITIDADTLPSNTLSPVDRIIDPHERFPGNGLAAATTGQRYLVVDDIPANTQAWGALSASTNDIIEYNGSNWVVAFDASVNSTVEVVTNIFDGQRFRYIDGDWVDVLNGVYRAGYWRLELFTP